jgi:hypothetical protein
MKSGKVYYCIDCNRPITHKGRCQPCADRLKAAKTAMDTDIMDWLCDHAIVIGIIREDGETEYIKIEGNDTSFRDLMAAEANR